MLTSYLLQAAPAAGGSGWSTMLFMVGFFAIFYFFMIRPQMKKAKEQKKMQEALKIGDRVMTIGGVHGEVIELDATTIVMKLDQGRMRIERSAISADRTVTEGQENK